MALPLTPNDEARRACSGDLLWLQGRSISLRPREHERRAAVLGAALARISGMLTRMDMDDIAHRIDCLLRGDD